MKQYGSPFCGRLTWLRRRLNNTIHTSQGFLGTPFPNSQSQFLKLNARRWFFRDPGAPSFTAKFTAQFEQEAERQKSRNQSLAEPLEFLKTSGWTLNEKPGEVITSLTKIVSNSNALIDIQILPHCLFTRGLLEAQTKNNKDQTEDRKPQLATYFSLTYKIIEERATQKVNSGIIFYCTTIRHNTKHRLLIGNICYYGSLEEKNNPSSYGGPEFEDLNDQLQCSIHSWLESLTINDELCDAIDTIAANKQQREHLRWLESLVTFMR